MKYCPKCKTEWPDKGKFCPKDGTPLRDKTEDIAAEECKTRLMDPEELVENGSEDITVDVEPKGGSGDRKKESEAFSETKWFMVGDHIKDEEIEAEDLVVEDLQKIYKKTSTLPSDVRKKFSLRYGTKEDEEEKDNKKKQ